VPLVRQILCWTFFVIVPSSLLLASDAPSAVLHVKGGVFVNGSEAPDALAIYAGDILETQAGFVANLVISGSTIIIQPESVVKYNGDSMTLEHGSVSVTTSTALTVDVDCLHVVPTSSNWTEYDVTHRTGKMQVSAVKLDVNVVHATSLKKAAAETAQAGSTTIHEGNQGTRETSDACGSPSGPTRGVNGINKKWIEIGAAAGGAGVICALLCKGSSPPNVSQSAP
jgi:hypothetical protein